MKTFLFLLIAILSLNTLVFAQQKPPLKSLTVGNFWVYEYSSSQVSRPDIPSDAYERVVGTQFVGGREYAKVFNSYFQQYFLERSDSNNVYRWDALTHTEKIVFSLLWKAGDTVNFQFLWHGCLNCKYIVTSPYTTYAPFIIKDTIYSFTLRDVVLRGTMPVAPYRVAYIRKYFLNQLDTMGLIRERPTTLGGTLLKGAYIDGVVYLDTNIVTSVVEEPPLPLAQTKQGNTTQASPRIAIAMSAENPFTTRTQVRYRLEQAGSVELAVYNTQGVRLTTFARTVQGAGDHTATWNGTNAEGQDVPAGTYFIVVFVNERQAGEVKVMKVR